MEIDGEIEIDVFNADGGVVGEGVDVRGEGEQKGDEHPYSMIVGSPQPWSNLPSLAPVERAEADGVARLLPGMFPSQFAFARRPA